MGNRWDAGELFRCSGAGYLSVAGYGGAGYSIAGDVLSQFLGHAWGRGDRDGLPGRAKSISAAGNVSVDCFTGVAMGSISSEWKNSAVRNTDDPGAVGFLALSRGSQEVSGYFHRCADGCFCFCLS